NPPSIPPMPPVHAANAVVTQTNEINSGSADSTEPPLKPNQPNHNRNTPITASGTEELAKVLGEPLSYLPRRGPNTIAPANAAQPPTECTTVEPAKS